MWSNSSHHGDSSNNHWNIGDTIYRTKKILASFGKKFCFVTRFSKLKLIVADYLYFCLNSQQIQKFNVLKFAKKIENDVRTFVFYRPVYFRRLLYIFFWSSKFNISKVLTLFLQRAFPAKLLYKIGLIITLLIVPVRFSCGLIKFYDIMVMVENAMVLVAVIMTTVHFLFYCRAVKFVGPFVLMIYTIITKDMIRFFVIYFIFLMGFSQGFYLIFLACERSHRQFLIEGGMSESQARQSK